MDPHSHDRGITPATLGKWTCCAKPSMGEPATDLLPVARPIAPVLQRPIELAEPSAATGLLRGRRDAPCPATPVR